MDNIDKERNKFVHEIVRLRIARKGATSVHLRRDYGKAIARMEAELAEYDRFRRQSRVQ